MNRRNRIESAFISLGMALVLTFSANCGGENPAQNGMDEVGAEDTSGRLVIIGGALQAENTEVYQAILDGREGEGPVCVFPTASAEPRESMESAIARIEAVGGAQTAEGIFLTVDNPEAAALPETVNQIEGCGGFYFVGGQQGRIVQVFRPEEGDSPAYEALMARFRSGAVVSGSSAGAAIMNDPMIGGGNSLGALAEGVRSGEGGEGVILEKGMGFLQDPLVDQHFLARGRWARLLVAVLETEGFTFGAGVDENTALVVDGSSAWVAGASGVVFFDTRNAVPKEAGLGASGVSVTLLGAGDAIDLENGAVEHGGGKMPWAGPVGDGNPFDSDLFRRWGLLAFFVQAGASSDSDFNFEVDGFRFVFTKSSGFRAVSGEGSGVQGAPAGLSVGPMILDFSTVDAG